MVSISMAGRSTDDPGPDASALAATFREYAEHEFRGVSALYTELVEVCLASPGLAEPLLAAPPRQRRPLLLFAAVQYLLRTVAAGHPLTDYLPVLGGSRPVDQGAGRAFADLVGAYRTELTTLCATRTTQTNEPARAAQLWPAFLRAGAGQRPLALIELGTSAGLLLLADRYGYRYRAAEGGRVEQVGRRGAALVLDCAVHGTAWPVGLDGELSIAARIGLDLSPIHAADPAAVAWLRSCIWPEQTGRLARLDAALAEATVAPPRLVSGDMVEALPAALSAVDNSVTPCVFASNAVNYLPPDDVHRLVGLLADVGADRDLVLVLNEVPRYSIDLFGVPIGEPAAGVPDRTAAPGGATGSLAMITWRAGRAEPEVLATTGPHGAWLRWAPARYAYRPRLGD